MTFELNVFIHSSLCIFQRFSTCHRVLGNPFFLNSLDIQIQTHGHMNRVCLKFLDLPRWVCLNVYCVYAVLVIILGPIMPFNPFTICHQAKQFDYNKRSSLYMLNMKHTSNCRFFLLVSFSRRWRTYSRWSRALQNRNQIGYTWIHLEESSSY